MSKTGTIVFTFVDHDANEFVELGGACWLSPKRARAEFDALSSVPHSDYVADLEDEHGGIVADKCVTPEIIEARMGEPVPALLARAKRRGSV